MQYTCFAAAASKGNQKAIMMSPDPLLEHQSLKLSTPNRLQVRIFTKRVRVVEFVLCMNQWHTIEL